MHKFPYKWVLKNAIFTKDKGNVFSCFACGGGSTMGYKLAGFNVLGCNEIDKRMIKHYVENHNPKYAFCEPIQTFKLKQDLPDELFNLDILDGSPPCSSFSMAGEREDHWGKEKKFKEGQQEQVLDTLFFDFIELGNKLRPKVIVAENVKGLLMGNAKDYVIRIYDAFEKSGYTCQHFVLDASKMGVPQKRERVFFIALRNDLCDKFIMQKDMFTWVPKITFDFNEPKILFSQIKTGEHKPINKGKPCKLYNLWLKKISTDRSFVDISTRVLGKGIYFNTSLISDDDVFPTLVSNSCYYTIDTCEIINKNELISVSTFPEDYIFFTDPKYIMGMCVPPVMTANISTNIYDQWLSKL